MKTIAALLVDGIEKLLPFCKITVPERVTFYGMREIGVRAPGGHTVIFATPVK